MGDVLGVVPAGHGATGRQGAFGMLRISGGSVGAAVVGVGVVGVVTCEARATRFLISSSVIPDTPCRSSHLQRPETVRKSQRLNILCIVTLYPNCKYHPFNASNTEFSPNICPCNDETKSGNLDF